MKTVITSLFLALGALPALGNVLLNPGFETDDASAGDVLGATDWFSFGNAYTSEAQAQSGTNSLKLFGEGFAGSNAGVVQFFPASPGDIWELRAWAFIDSSDPITGTDFAVVKIEFFDGADPNTANIIREIETANVDENTPTDVWTEFSLAVTAPPGTVAVQAVIVFVEDNATPAGGAVYFDDADLENIGPAVAVDPGVLTNSSFEDDDASGGDVNDATGWAVFDPGARFTVSKVSRFGGQSVKMFGPFVPEGGQAVYQDSAAAPYDVWTASAFAYNFKSPAGTQNPDDMVGDNFGVVQVQFLNAADEAIATFDSAPINANSPKSTWIELTASGTAPLGTVKARILLLHVQLNIPVTGGAIFYDDASLAKTGQVDPPLLIVDVSKSGSTASITFLGADSATYSLLKSTTLDPGLASFSPVAGQTAIPGAGGPTAASDTAASEGKAFYAIQKNP